VPIARGVKNEREGRPIGSRASDHGRYAKCDGSVAVLRQRSILLNLIRFGHKIDVEEDAIGLIRSK
jgi:hypothetical protein